MNFLNSQRPQIVFECTRLNSTSKRGVVKPNEDGSYVQVIGGLNAYNSTGDLYEYEAGLSFFQNMSSFQRRIQRGVLRAEYGHPKPSPGMSIEDYSRRISQIEEKSACGTWTKIWLSNEKLKDEKGREFIPIMGAIRPYGPFGDALKRGFEQEGEQVCFSIRSFTNDTPSRFGGKIKRLVEIITFDYVNEPGIRGAEKLLSPNLESYSLETYEGGTIDALKLRDVLLEERALASLESSKEQLSSFADSLEELIEKESKSPSNLFTLW